MNFENNTATQQQEVIESELISLQEAMAEAVASYDSEKAGEIQEQIKVLNAEKSAKHDTALAHLAQESTEDSNSPEKMMAQAQTEAIAEDAKRTVLEARVTRETEDKVKAEGLLKKIQGGAEKKSVDFSTAQSLEELSSMLNNMESYKDPIAGEVSIERLRQNVMEMNTDLGQAAGLIAQNGKYEGTPQQIVEGVLAKISTFPSSLQDVYRRVATEYINQKISEAEGAPVEQPQEAIKGGIKFQEGPIEKSLEAPKTEVFEMYGEKIRQSAKELADVMKVIQVNEKTMYDQSLDMSERLKAQEADRILNGKRNALREKVLYGVGVRKIHSSYEDYDKEMRASTEYKATVMDDPQTTLLLAESGQLGNGYREKEGIGQLSGRLRSNLEHMTKLLDALPSRDSAESFFVHCSGEARQNRDLYIAAIKKNHLNYQWGKKDWAQDPEIQKIALESGLDSMYLQK